MPTLRQQALEAAHAQLKELGWDSTPKEFWDAVLAARSAVDDIRTADGRRISDRDHIVASAFFAALNDIDIQQTAPLSNGGMALVRFAHAMAKEL